MTHRVCTSLFLPLATLILLLGNSVQAAFEVGQIVSIPFADSKENAQVTRVYENRETREVTVVVSITHNQHVLSLMYTEEENFSPTKIRLAEVSNTGSVPIREIHELKLNGKSKYVSEDDIPIPKILLHRLALEEEESQPDD